MLQDRPPEKLGTEVRNNNGKRARLRFHKFKQRAHQKERGKNVSVVSRLKRLGENIGSRRTRIRERGVKTQRLAFRIALHVGGKCHQIQRVGAVGLIHKLPGRCAKGAVRIG